MSDRKEAFEKGKAKIPTGISSIDLAASGGFPSGSFVILFGKTGSGRESFIHTSAFLNAARKNGILPRPSGDNVFLPEKILYIPLSKTKEDVLRNVKVGYSDDLSGAFEDAVIFKDLMTDYYSSTLAPLETPEEEVEVKVEEEAIEIVKSIIEFLNEKGKNNLVIIDSLDDLIRAFPDGKERNILASLRQIRSKNRENWNSLILNRLTEDLFPRKAENSILSLADGVFEFETKSSGGKRTRSMNCNKFSGVTSEELLESTFEFNVTNSGLEARRTTLLET